MIVISRNTKYIIVLVFADWVTFVFQLKGMTITKNTMNNEPIYVCRLNFVKERDQESQIMKTPYLPVCL